MQSDNRAPKRAWSLLHYATDGERRGQVQLKEISQIPQESGGTGALAQFDALLEVENPDGALLPGMTAKVFFVAEAARDVLTAPRGAVTFADAPISAVGQYAQQAAANAPGEHQEPGLGSQPAAAASTAACSHVTPASDAPPARPSASVVPSTEAVSTPPGRSSPYQRTR